VDFVATWVTFKFWEPPMETDQENDLREGTPVPLADRPVPVTSVIRRLVKPGREGEFEQWVRGISRVAARFPGHLGINIFRPRDPAHPEYLLILQFDREENLRGWLESDVRRDWIRRSEDLTQGPEQRTQVSGLEHWFTLPGRPVPQPPPRFKMAILTVAAAWPIVMGVSVLLGAILPGLGMAGGTLLTTVVLTALLTYVAMPNLTRLFYGWLYPASGKG
jgi:uncharacterized protein